MKPIEVKRCESMETLTMRAAFQSPIPFKSQDQGKPVVLVLRDPGWVP